MGTSENPFRLVRLVGGHKPGEGLAFVFVCYLDDSDSVDSTVLTVAGYWSHISRWEAFEHQAKKLWDEYGVDILHATEFRNGDGCFTGWTVDKKRSFVDRLMRIAEGEVLLNSGLLVYSGLSASIRKSAFKLHAKKRKELQQQSAYNMAFGLIVNSLTNQLQEPHLSSVLNEGLSFVVESGHKNNPGIERYFHDQKTRGGYNGCLRSLTFSGKTESKAIQFADLLAFYARRHMNLSDKTDHKQKMPYEWPLDRMQKILPHCYFFYVGGDFLRFGSHQLAAEAKRKGLF